MDFIDDPLALMGEAAPTDTQNFDSVFYGLPVQAAETTLAFDPLPEEAVAEPVNVLLLQHEAGGSGGSGAVLDSAAAHMHSKEATTGSATTKRRRTNSGVARTARMVARKAANHNTEADSDSNNSCYNLLEQVPKAIITEGMTIAEIAAAKKKERKMRNRASAQVSRNRKKAEYGKLKSAADELHRNNTLLWKENVALKKQMKVLQLENTVLTEQLQQAEGQLKQQQQQQRTDDEKLMLTPSTLLGSSHYSNHNNHHNNNMDVFNLSRSSSSRSRSVTPPPTVPTNNNNNNYHSLQATFAAAGSAFGFLSTNTTTVSSSSEEIETISYASSYDHDEDSSNGGPTKAFSPLLAKNTGLFKPSSVSRPSTYLFAFVFAFVFLYAGFGTNTISSSNNMLMTTGLGPPSTRVSPTTEFLTATAILQTHATQQQQQQQQQQQPSPGNRVLQGYNPSHPAISNVAHGHNDHNDHKVATTTATATTATTTTTTRSSSKDDTRSFDEVQFQKMFSQSNFTFLATDAYDATGTGSDHPSGAAAAYFFCPNLLHLGTAFEDANPAMTTRPASSSASQPSKALAHRLGKQGYHKEQQHTEKHYQQHQQQQQQRPSNGKDMFLFLHRDSVDAALNISQDIGDLVPMTCQIANVFR